MYYYEDFIYILSMHFSLMLHYLGCNHNQNIVSLLVEKGVVTLYASV